MYMQPFNVSRVPSEPWGNHTSTSCTSSHSGPSSSSVSPGSHYMNHIKINPFPDVLCPQWAQGAISCQSHVHQAVRCTMCPHWAPGATRLQHPLHLAISDVLGPCEPKTPLYEPRQYLSFFRHYLSPMSHGSHFLSVSCTSSRSMCYVSPLSRGANILHQPVHLPILGLLGPEWAIGVTIWNTSRSSHLRTFCVPNEPWELLYINGMYN